MLLVANLGDTKLCKKPREMTETLSNGYSSESTPRELSNEYQNDRVWMIFKNLCVLVLWMKVASALEGLTHSCTLIPKNIFYEYEFTLKIKQKFGEKLKERDIYLIRISSSNIF